MGITVSSVTVQLKYFYRQQLYIYSEQHWNLVFEQLCWRYMGGAIGPWLNAIFGETNRSRVIIHSYCSFDYCKHGEMNIKWMHNVPSIVLVFSVVAARKGLALQLEVHSVFHGPTHTTHCSYLNHSCYRNNNPQIASVYTCWHFKLTNTLGIGIHYLLNMSGDSTKRLCFVSLKVFVNIIPEWSSSYISATHGTHRYWLPYHPCPSKEQMINVLNVEGIQVIVIYLGQTRLCSRLG